jgi:hypothetical protein
MGTSTWSQARFIVRAPLLYLQNNGDGTFTATEIHFSLTTLIAVVAAADVNGDGQLDLVARMAAAMSHENQAPLQSNSDHTSVIVTCNSHELRRMRRYAKFIVQPLTRILVLAYKSVSRTIRD